MEHIMSEKICKYLLSINVISQELFDIYIYGMELLLSFIINTVIILLIGIVSGKILPTLIFLILFVAVRRFTGGFHANTYLKCKIITVGTYIAVLCLSSLYYPPTVIKMLCYLAGILLIALFGPIENPNKPLDDNEKKLYKILSLIVFVILALLSLVFENYVSSLCNTAFYTLTAIIALMIIPILKKETLKNEKTC